MQKVVGSSPIIRSSQARWKRRVFFHSRPRRPRRDIGHGNEMATLDDDPLASGPDLAEFRPGLRGWRDEWQRA
jgi:hypothetical protein